MNVAHVLTFSRILISPIFPLLYLEHEWLGVSLVWMPWILLFLLVLSEWSDFVDGMWARKKNQVTDLGRVLDPMADSITHISLFLTFTQGVVQLPLLLVLVFLYRDLFISTLRTLCALKGVALAARLSGKIKAVMQGVVAALILVLLILYTQGWIMQETVQQLSLFLVSVTALYTAVSVVDYLVSNRFYIRKALES